MKEIELTHGYKTIVDDEDYEMLNQYHWCANIDKRRPEKCGSKIRVIGSVEGKTYLMHRYLTGADKTDTEVDHINGNSLDNRRSNLRIVTRQQNTFNRPMRGDSGNPYKGIKQFGNRWYARIKINGKTIHLGSHPSMEEAANAYNNAAKKYFGEFARLNVIDGDSK